MLNEIKHDTEVRMQKALTTLTQELSKHRTGRAHPSLLDRVTISYYGTEMPLNQTASISAGDARTLVISPWEKNMIPEIEKAIRSAELGLNPVTSGQVIRVPLPPLTEERRRDLVKLVRADGENARVAVRNIRRDANNQLKDLLKDKTISEDELRRSEEVIQKLTDKYIAETDKMLTHKEAEIMEI